jgi:hypothetical protein
MNCKQCEQSILRDDQEKCKENVIGIVLIFLGNLFIMVRIQKEIIDMNIAIIVLPIYGILHTRQFMDSMKLENLLSFQDLTTILLLKDSFHLSYVGYFCFLYCILCNV